VFLSNQNVAYRFLSAAKFSLATIVIVFVAGCQPLPQPFAHPQETINPTVIPSPDFAGVTILPIPDLPEQMAHDLSMAMAKELLAHEIIAGLNSSNQRSKFLQGGIIQIPIDNGRTKVTAIWDLTDNTGEILATQETTQMLSSKGWKSGSQATLYPLVKGPAAAIAGLVKGQDSQSSLTNLHVRPLDGEPTAARAPLQHEMEKALKRRNFRIVNDLETAGLVIAGAIELGPETIEPRPIKIVWSILNPSGQEVGKLTQQNTLQRKMLEHGWKTLAPLIADSAAGGVSDLVIRLPRNSGKKDRIPPK
jgi:hypothetical protein